MKKHLNVIFIVAMILSVLMSQSFKANGAFAQILETETPTLEIPSIFTPEPVEIPSVTPEIISTEIPTTELTATPVSDVTTVPEATETPQPTETSTELPTESLTPTSTETPGATPTLAAGEMEWSIEIDIPINSNELKPMGGSNGGKIAIEDALDQNISDEEVLYDVDTKTSTVSQTTYSVSLTGIGGLDQFKQTIYDDLQKQFNLLSGPISMSVTLPVSTGQEISIILDSNLSTGYFWELTDYDQTVLSKLGKPDFEMDKKGIGIASTETITLRSSTDGYSTIILRYWQPFNKTAAVTRRINLKTGETNGELDISNPYLQMLGGGGAIVPGLLANDVPVVTPADLQSAPATFNWAAQGKVTPIRNQGGCGSCWAFSTVGAMEAAVKIQSGQDVDLSEQFLVSCNNEGYSCNGGWFVHKYHTNSLGKLQSTVGAVLESDFQYTASNTACKAVASHPYKASSWYSIGGGTIPSVESIKSTILNYGPVSVAVCVGPGFNSYRSGVFNTDEKSSCSGSVNHAVVLTGWDDATQSWVMRNSWGTGWGEQGYMRIGWGVSNIGYGATYLNYDGPLQPAPANDSIDTPLEVVLNNNSFAHSMDISTASSAANDPTLSCVASKGYKTVWYRFSPLVSASYNINTLGSAYDTVLGVWQGSAGSLTSLGCNDDSVGNTSKVEVVLNAGVTYYIEVAGYDQSAVGNLTLNLSQIAVIEPTATNTATNTPTATFTRTPTNTATPTKTKTNTPTNTATRTPTNTKTPTRTPTLVAVGVGTVDDNDARIKYSGYKYQAITGNYKNTEHYSGVIGSTTRVKIIGDGFDILYRMKSNMGEVQVYIDNVLAGTINEYSPIITYKNVQSFRGLTNGEHEVTLKHLSGTYTNFDAIKVTAPPTATSTPTKTKTPTSTPTLAVIGAGTYDDISTKIKYQGYGYHAITGNYANTEHFSSVLGSITRLKVNGSGFDILYRMKSNMGEIEIFVDGISVGKINEYSSVIKYKNVWSYRGLTAGDHEITIKHLTGAYTNFDAIKVITLIAATPTITP